MIQQPEPTDQKIHTYSCKHMQTLHSLIIMQHAYRLSRSKNFEIEEEAENSACIRKCLISLETVIRGPEFPPTRFEETQYHICQA